MKTKGRGIEVGKIADEIDFFLMVWNFDQVFQRESIRGKLPAQRTVEY
jgi:hypothetical protein